MNDVFLKQSELGTCDIVDMTEHFFGYGRLDARYQLIGREAKMDMRNIH